MTQFLPANLLALFTARPAIPFKPPPEGLKKRKNSQPYLGVADYLREFEATEPPPATRGETREEKDDRKRRENRARAEAQLQDKLLRWDPHSDVNATGDPFKTLFVARVNFDTTESKLRRELEAYGPIKRICLIFSRRSRRPRGYAFVEYEHERDMHSAYKHADGKKIDGRRIVVDVERGRTVKSWRPRRLGGGLGGTRRGGPDENIRHSGRVEQWESRGGGGGEGPGGERDRERGREERRERKRSRSPRDRRERRDGDRERGDKDRGDRDRDRERRRERGRDRDRSEKDGERERGDRSERDGEKERGDRGERDGERERGDRGERDGERERGDRGERDGERERGDRGDRSERDGERERSDRGERDVERERERRERSDRREREYRDRREEREDRGDRERDNGRARSREEDGEIKQEEFNHDYEKVNEIKGEHYDPFEEEPAPFNPVIKEEVADY